MDLKNYTSGVPVSKTIGRIEEILAKSGATGIMKKYKDGVLEAISFSIELPVEKRQVAVQLPANVDAVYTTMRNSIKRPRRDTLNKLKEQSERTAWKLMQDWVEVQISLIQIQKIDFMQVFLPYIWNGEQTFYHVLKEQKFKALLPEQGSHFEDT